MTTNEAIEEGNGMAWGEDRDWMRMQQWQRRLPSAEPPPPRDVEGARATTREAGQEEEKGEGRREKGGGPRAPPRSSEF